MNTCVQALRELLDLRNSMQTPVWNGQAPRLFLVENGGKLRYFTIASERLNDWS